MPDVPRPLILSCPLPRSLDLIFTPERRRDLHARYEVVETTDEQLSALPGAVLGAARYIIGQPPLAAETLARLHSLRCIFNVESNLLNNMPYDQVFARGIHVVTTGAVFAEPVAEIGLGFALSLLRNIHGADADFRTGQEAWGGASNGEARLLSGAEVGIIGFGDLGRAVARVLGEEYQGGDAPRSAAFRDWLIERVPVLSWRVSQEWGLPDSVTQSLAGLARAQARGGFARLSGVVFMGAAMSEFSVLSATGRIRGELKRLTCHIEGDSANHCADCYAWLSSLDAPA